MAYMIVVMGTYVVAYETGSSHPNPATGQVVALEDGAHHWYDRHALPMKASYVTVGTDRIVTIIALPLYGFLILGACLLVFVIIAVAIQSGKRAVTSMRGKSN